MSFAVFRAPELYTRLLEQFAGVPAPGKDVLKRLLQRDYGIVESMAGNAADAFIESLNAAGLVNSAGIIDAGPTPAAADGKASTGATAPAAAEPKPGMQAIEVPADLST